MTILYRLENRKTQDKDAAVALQASISGFPVNYKTGYGGKPVILEVTFSDRTHPE